MAESADNAPLRAGALRGAHRLRHALARRGPFRRDAGRTDRGGRTHPRRPGDRARRRRKIRTIVKRWIADPDVDVVITTGGTGFTGRDVTPEAIEPLFEKRMDGFSAVFHRISYDKIGTSTVQSRATAGLAGTTFIFCLPGSPGACRDAWDGILVKQFDYRQPPCNFVEIMPRLDEHLKRGKLRAKTEVGERAQAASRPIRRGGRREQRRARSRRRCGASGDSAGAVARVAHKRRGRAAAHRRRRPTRRARSTIGQGGRSRWPPSSR